MVETHDLSGDGTPAQQHAMRMHEALERICFAMWNPVRSGFRQFDDLRQIAAHGLSREPEAPQNDTGALAGRKRARGMSFED